MDLFYDSSVSHKLRFERLETSRHGSSCTCRHDLGAAIGPLHLLRPPTQHVIEVGAGKADSAFSGQAKALFSAALVLELGHLAIPDT